MSRTTLAVGAVALTMLLFVSMIAKVTATYRGRGLFAELEFAQQTAKGLEAEGNRLRIELGRVAQPATIEASARAMGMRPATPDRTVLLPAPPSTGSAR